ncbi:MAG: MFS transporter [Chitinophagaceae bacterium]|nr:MFS transporter [Chitinophagaceae bacterium]
MWKNLSSFIRLRPVFAVSILLACTSLLFGIWVGAIPEIKVRLGLSDGTLGLSLLLSPLGALTAVALSGRLFSRIAVGTWMVTGYLSLALIMIMLVNAPNLYVFWISLYLFGINGFFNGVSVNTTINAFEKKYNRKLMSTSHALYSIGGGISTGLVPLFVAGGLGTTWQILIMATFVASVVFFNRKHLLSHDEIIHSRSGLKFPSLSVLSISFICLVIFMSEGCVADWSAIYFREVIGAPKELLSLGYTGFAVAMTIGRLNGDGLVTRIGSKTVVIGGASLAAAGFLLVVLSSSAVPGIIGYILVGFGCSCIVPVLFSASGNIPGVKPVDGFAMVTTGGLIGFLAGPSLIGFISEKTNLSSGLILLVFMTALAAVIASRSKLLENKKMTGTNLEYDEPLY